MSHYLAIDLGAESGRVMAGSLKNGKLKMEELHRFPNEPVHLPTGFYWDILRLWNEVMKGLAIAGRDRKIKPAGIGVDTWAVDIAFLGSDGALVDNPRHYRDPRLNGMVEKTCAVVSREEIFANTGVQFLQINSLYQWYAMKLAWSPALDTARTLFFIPDLFNYLLTGVKKAELTVASTSQFYNPIRGNWATELIQALRLESAILPEIVVPGAPLGPLLPYVSAATGLPRETPVFATASHDTAAAVAAVPADVGDDWCYISSGTWSLMGVELEEPCINTAALEQNFTNEIGVEGRVRFLKNIVGMWILQECRRAWAAEGQEYSYDELAKMARSARAFVAVIQPDQFLEAGRMPERILEYCERTDQAVPEGPGEMARVILESLAMKYRHVLEGMEKVTGRSISKIHIVGGGSQNMLLNQFVADCTRRTVIAGPTEATAAGNILVQAMGAGEIVGLDNVRQVVKKSFDVTTVEPHRNSLWDAAYEVFCTLP